MSQLKTLKSMQTAQSLSSRSSRRESLLSKKMINLSICHNQIKPENILKKMGASCSFLYPYLGPEEELRQLHAKYSDTNKRMHILWPRRASPDAQDLQDPLRK